MGWLDYLNNSVDDELKNAHKIATIEDTNEEFKYYRLERTDIMQNKMLEGIHISDTVFVIVTSYDYNFNTSTTITINGVLHTIDTIYTNTVENENNKYNISGLTKKYLTLRVDR